MTPASAILDRTTLLVRDHLVDGVDGDIVALAFSRTLVGVVVNADLLGFRGFASALETFRVLMAGMCIPMRVEVLGAVPQFRFGPPFESESSFEAFLAYRSKASAAAALGTVNRSCAIRIGLGVSDSSLDFEIAANEAFCWVRQRGPKADWQAADIWTGASAAVLGAAEVEKFVIRQLGDLARLDAELLPVRDFQLGCPKVNASTRRRKIAFISAGAITNAALFMLSRLGLSLDVEVWDDDVVHVDNLNRYPLFDVSDLGALKVTALARLNLGSVRITPVSAPFRADSSLGATTIVVGADRVAPRWEAARRSPKVAIIGATDHYLTLTSIHTGDGGCPGCLHPRDDGIHALIPTVSYVSFAAGLEVAAFVAQGQGVTRYLLMRSWLRPDVDLGRLSGPVPVSPACPVSSIVH